MVWYGLLQDASNHDPSYHAYYRGPASSHLHEAKPDSHSTKYPIYDNLLLSSQFTRNERQPTTQPPIHSPRLRIHITRLIARKKQHRPRNLIRLSAPPCRINLPNLLLAAPRPRSLIRNLRHTRFDQPRTNGITPNPRARQLKRARLHQIDDRGFTRRVVRGAGVAPQPRHRRSSNDAALWMRLLVRRPEHSATGVFGCQEDAERVGAHHVHEARRIFFPEHFAAGYPCVGEEDVEPVVCV